MDEAVFEILVASYKIRGVKMAKFRGNCISKGSNLVDETFQDHHEKDHDRRSSFSASKNSTCVCPRTVLIFTVADVSLLFPEKTHWDIEVAWRLRESAFFAFSYFNSDSSFSRIPKPKSFKLDERWCDVPLENGPPR